MQWCSEENRKGERKWNDVQNSNFIFENIFKILFFNWNIVAEWKILFESILRIAAQEKHLRKLWELFFLLEVKAQLYKYFWDRGLYINCLIIERLHNPYLNVMLLCHVISYKIYLYFLSYNYID